MTRCPSIFSSSGKHTFKMDSHDQCIHCGFNRVTQPAMETFLVVSSNWENIHFMTVDGYEFERIEDDAIERLNKMDREHSGIHWITPLTADLATMMMEVANTFARRSMA